MKTRQSVTNAPFKWKQGLVMLFLVMIILGCAGCQRVQYRQATGMVWHTTYHITYESHEDLSDSIIAVCNDMGASLNVFDPRSLVARINSGESSETDEHFRNVHAMSLKINKVSDGAFDPTLGPLIDAWGFGHGHKATKDTLRLDSLLQFVGIQKTRIENGLLIKSDPRISFNFSAIAKGYGCDLVASMLERNGVENYLVEIGGEIRCNGMSPMRRKWRVSIDRPIVSDSVVHDSQCVVELSSGGLATSGNYRNHNSHTAPGTGHTISVKTGRPAVTDILSATVIAPSAMEADALATALMAMGSAKAKKLAEDIGYPTLLVLSDQSVWQQKIELSDL